MTPFKFNKEQFLNDISENRSTMMGLSIIAIILFHQDFITGFPLNVFQYYGYWGVEVFLLLSGMGLVNSLQKYPTRTYFQRRLLRLFPSCLFCGILKCVGAFLLSILILIPYDTFPINWLSPFSLDLWFIRAIIVYYLLSPWLYKFLLEKPVITIAVVISLFLINGILFRVHDCNSPTWIIERLPVFCIGMILKLKNDVLSTKSLILSLVFLLTAVVIVAIFRGEIYDASLPWTIMILSLAFGTTAMIYLITLLLKRIPQTILIPFKWTGTMSLELYLVHEFVFGIVKGNTSHLLGNTGQLTVSIMLSFILAFLCKWVIDNTYKK